MRKHQYSFFGQRTAMLLSSSDWEDPVIYLRFIKNKGNNIWEKPSQGEGKNIKLNLLEIISILDILNDPSQNKWTTVHKYNGDTTSIVFELKGKTLSVSITGYPKYLGAPETKLFKLLLEHILEEKICYATSNNHNRNNYTNNQDIKHTNNHNITKNHTANNNKKINNNQYKHQNTKNIQNKQDNHNIQNKQDKQNNRNIKNSALKPKINPHNWLENLKSINDFCLLPGEVTSMREKALSFLVLNKREIWVPISQIDDTKKTNGGIWVKKWFLEKKLDDIFNN